MSGRLKQAELQVYSLLLRKSHICHWTIPAMCITLKFTTQKWIPWNDYTLPLTRITKAFEPAMNTGTTASCKSLPTPLHTSRLLSVGGSQWETTPTYLSWVWLYMRAVEAILLHSWKAKLVLWLFLSFLALRLTVISWSHTEFYICWTFLGYSSLSLSLSDTPTTWESVCVRPPPLDYAAAATWLSVPYHSFLVWKQSGNGLEKCNTCLPLLQRLQ